MDKALKTTGRASTETLPAVKSTNRTKLFFRLLLLSARMDMLWLLRDTRNCLLVMVTDLIGTASGIAGIALLAVRFDGIGGMSQSQVLFMLGYATCIDGLFMLFFGMTNTGMISRIIGRGQLEHMLVQPVPLPIQIFTSGFIPFTGSSVLIGGIALTVTAARPLGMGANPLWIPVMAGSLAASLAVILAFSLSHRFGPPFTACCRGGNLVLGVRLLRCHQTFSARRAPPAPAADLLQHSAGRLVACFRRTRILGLPAAGLSLFFLTFAGLPGARSLPPSPFGKDCVIMQNFGTQRYSEHAPPR